MTRLRAVVAVVVTAGCLFLLANIAGVSAAYGNRFYPIPRPRPVTEVAFGTVECSIFQLEEDGFSLLVSIGYFSGTAGVFSANETGDISSRVPVEALDPALCDAFEAEGEQLGCLFGSFDDNSYGGSIRRRADLVCQGSRGRVVRAIGRLSAMVLQLGS